MINDILMYGNCIVNPLTLRNDILSRLHAGHQYIVKCYELARQTVWWPKCSLEITKMLKCCRKCQQDKPLQKEPLLPTICPD